MINTTAITFRMDKAMRDYLQARAKRSDRSMNGEFSAIFRNLMETEKASDPALESKSDASHAE